MERLQKVMARRGVASRRKCEELIQAGRVTVNGKIVRELGAKVSAGDRISVDGWEFKEDAPRVYILLNKPKGYVTTASDPEGRKTVLDLLSGIQDRVFPVGRLDYDTEGLLLLTNDGELSFALTHPKYGVDKTYTARVWGVPSESKLQELSRGIMLEDGITAPAKVKLLSRGRQSEVQISIHQGKKRQVRRMLQAVGHRVVSLRRIRFGPLNLGGLPLGSFRHLTRQEVAALKAAVNKVPRNKPGVQGYGRKTD